MNFGFLHTLAEISPSGRFLVLLTVQVDMSFGVVSSSREVRFLFKKAKAGLRLASGRTTGIGFGGVSSGAEESSESSSDEEAFASSENIFGPVLEIGLEGTLLERVDSLWSFSDLGSGNDSGVCAPFAAAATAVGGRLG